MKVISNMERLKNILKEKGLKPTYQRLKILEYLNKHAHRHPTVEMIYEALVGRIPTISMTTIYNTLNAFLEKNIASAVTITGTELRYDITTKSHHHFLCKKCGEIIDVDVKCPIIEKQEVKGHKIDEIHGYFKGVCKNCLSKRQHRTKH